MHTVRAILAELAGLFVDDGFLALGLLLWCVGVAAAANLQPEFRPIGAVVWCFGCALILLVSLVRARRAR